MSSGKPVEPTAVEPAAVEVDCRGLLCPLPVLRARQALEKLPVGAVVSVVCTDPASELDLEVFCATKGHQWLSLTRVGDELHFRIRRAEGHSESDYMLS